MNEHQAMTAVAKMFAAHGTLKPAEVVAELAGEALDASCGACALRVLEIGRGGKYSLTVQTFREGFQREVDSPDHSRHVGQSDRSVEVGREEARRRTEGVTALVAAGLEEQRAQVAAAMCWANGMPIDHDRVWDHHVPRHVDDRVIEAAWAYARACVTHEPMSDVEWGATFQPWHQVWLEANRDAQ